MRLFYIFCKHSLFYVVSYSLFDYNGLKGGIKDVYTNIYFKDEKQ